MNQIMNVSGTTLPFHFWCTQTETYNNVPINTIITIHYGSLSYPWYIIMIIASTYRNYTMIYRALYFYDGSQFDVTVNEDMCLPWQFNGPGWDNVHFDLKMVSDKGNVFSPLQNKEMCKDIHASAICCWVQKLFRLLS